MNDSITIPKNPDLAPSQDYAFLREQGMKHIEQLSGSLWTDYNIHDPGITLLELLYYAITDLGYRTSYDIGDLLADQSAPGPKQEDHFHTAREILTSKPVTLQDYRRILIDIEGVKNAWLEPLWETYPELYLNCKKGGWQPEANEHTKRINLQGLYRVTLELDEDEELGDLNDFVFEIDLYADPDEEDRDERLIIRFPDWSTWLNKEIQPGNIEEVSLASIERTSETRFKGTVQIKAGGRSYGEEMTIKATDRDIPLKDVEDRIEDESLLQQYREKTVSALRIGRTAFYRLHENRSLCEDFEEFRGLDVEKIRVCADVALDNDAELERVLAELYHRIDHHIAPQVYFYSLREMMDMDIPTDAIFEGPALDHGFISSGELEKAEIKKQIFVSDIIQIMMDVEGVKSVENVLLANIYKGETLNDKIKWCHTVGEGRVPRFSPGLSDIDLFKENLPYKPNADKVARYVKELEELERNSKLSADEEYDLSIPNGQNRNVARFTSIQEQLPLTYGVGSAGIPGVVTDRRRAQAKQLKAYLTLYDQMLANYLSQLANLKNLFSLSPDIHQTYFYQVLYDLPQSFAFPEGDPGLEVLFNGEESPHIYQVIKDFIQEISGQAGIDLDDYNTFRSKWEKYKKETGLGDESSTHFVKKLDEIVESKKTFENRRNRFLDHLLARFGESFTDYVLLMFSRQPGEHTAPDLIHDKIEFLQEYPAISSSRGRGFNYKAEGEVWGTENVSGLEKRASRLLGIERYDRRRLSCKDPDELFEIYRDEGGEWRFRLVLPEDEIVLRSEGYTRRENCEKGIEAVKIAGVDFENYELSEASDGRYYFNLIGKNGEIIGTGILYEGEKERDRIVAVMIAALSGKCNREGFHLIEHILLRPEEKDDPKLPACVQKNCNDCPGYLDPYSFRVSLIVPYWPDRFDDMAFRRFLEKTIRMEAPAHVHLKICWADQKDMKDFEPVYRDWLETKAKPTPDPGELRDKLGKLIEVMRQIRSVYPVATLHDYREDSDDNPMLLDNTVLGTFNPE
ncbi:DUF1508 domain-containing protein [Halalkalibaculum sp. DA3122]|uniref:YegP family protein n=1 Tax=Halalkalibaculum sp. DA3122 TaxID=3373607 RepID=UPI003753F3B2